MYYWAAFRLFIFDFAFIPFRQNENLDLNLWYTVISYAPDNITTSNEVILPMKPRVQTCTADCVQSGEPPISRNICSTIRCDLSICRQVSRDLWFSFLPERCITAQTARPKENTRGQLRTVLILSHAKAQSTSTWPLTVRPHRHCKRCALYLFAPHCCLKIMCQLPLVHKYEFSANNDSAWKAWLKYFVKFKIDLLVSSLVHACIPCIASNVYSSQSLHRNQFI